MTHFTSRTRTAPKVHRCDVCRRTIDPGEQYRVAAGMGEGTAWTWTECAHCRILAFHVCMDSGQFEYDADTIADWEPVDIAGLRVKALWRRQWRRRDGAPYPVPIASGGASIRMPEPGEKPGRRPARYQTPEVTA